MKRILLASVFLLFALPCLGADVKLAWDLIPTQPWEKVRIYERTGTAPAYTYTLRAEVDGTVNTATLTGVTPGMHTYIGRAYNTPWESVDSNPASTGPVPSPLPNFKVVVVVTVTVP